MRRSILIIDDEAAICRSLSGALTDEGFDVSTVDRGEKALNLLRDRPHDLVLLDIWMPELDGLETLQLLRREFPDQLVIMMSGHGTIETAVRATKTGAYDFIEKPISLERLLTTLKNAFSLLDARIEASALRRKLDQGREILGTSAAIRDLKDVLGRVAPTTGSVLVLGENGTGKELVAHAIHSLSPRAHRPLVEVNCAAIPEELIESELFGHEKGAFTGATQLKRGKFDLAHGGTLFLDEIGDMSVKTQAKILRILQEQRFERVGGSQTIHVDVRVVAATNKDLKAEIQAGRFREDLYYRLNVIKIVVPPLRDRPEDISVLADAFLKEFSAVYHKPLRTLSEPARDLLLKHSWPGNVRELRNLMERIVILSGDRDLIPVPARSITQHLEGLPQGAEIELPKDFKAARTMFEHDMILRALEASRGSISKAAQALGLERSYLNKKIKSLGIEFGGGLQRPGEDVEGRRGHDLNPHNV